MQGENCQQQQAQAGETTPSRVVESRANMPISESRHHQHHPVGVMCARDQVVPLRRQLNSLMCVKVTGG